MRSWPTISALVLGLAWPSLVGATVCDLVFTGLDTTQADLQIPAWYSNQPSQVFDAPDTVLMAVTVWRVPQSVGVFQGKLYVMEVDSIVGLVRPDESKLLLDGPTLQLLAGDGIHPTEETWIVDPPLVLPRRGQFAFEIVPLPCAGGELTAFLGRSGNPYPGGSFWNFDTADCGPGCCPDNPWEGTIDLAFRVDFCETPVPTQKMTWGELRAAYR
ncbi:MAG TPA: hypothetical protein VGR66_01440 [Candidatus Eisenbacteria bacterium]|nr:hypothetical protein [Candidatus Eisenbacteria bacterium]